MTLIDENSIQHVAIVHPGSLMRHALTAILEEFHNISIFSAASLKELCNDIHKNPRLGVILFNIDDVSQDIIHLTSLRTQYPAIKLLALSHHYELEDLFALFEIDIDGALLDDVSQNTLKLAFRILKEGQKLFPSNMAQVLLARIQPPCAAVAPDIIEDEVDLSRREREILHCLEKGDSNKRIALRLDIAEATVKVHVKSILRKIGVDNRTQAAIWSLRQRTRPFGQTFFAAPHRSLSRFNHLPA
jgi:two-component system nitrate/nitrite response regulator NarL